MERERVCGFSPSVLLSVETSGGRSGEEKEVTVYRLLQILMGDALIHLIRSPEIGVQGQHFLSAHRRRTLVERPHHHHA